MSSKGSASYHSDAPALQMDSDSEELLFEWTFRRRTAVVGYPKAVLYMSCQQHDDMDVFVQMRKADEHGTILQNINIPLEDLHMKAEDVETTNLQKYLGPNGTLRASRRKLNEELSTSYWPIHAHDTDQKISPGEVVKLSIGLWPTGIIFECGQKLVLKVAGHSLVLAEYVALRGTFQAENKGTHVVHFGGDYGSHVVLPLVDI